mgnify:CR=1 FL=1
MAGIIVKIGKGIDSGKVKSDEKFYQFGQNITKLACDNDKIANIN